MLLRRVWPVLKKVLEGGPCVGIMVRSGLGDCTSGRKIRSARTEFLVMYIVALRRNDTYVLLVVLPLTIWLTPPPVVPSVEAVFCELTWNFA